MNVAQSQADSVYQRLRSSILAGRLAPSHKLNISSLCGELGGSLGAVREGLSRLLAEGLVISEPYRGYRVAPISAADLLELTEARIAIEGLCLKSSLSHGDIEWEGRLIALLHQLTRLSDSGTQTDDWARIHAAFHDCLVSACDNRWLLFAHEKFREQSERYRRLSGSLDVEYSDRNTLREHTDIVEAAISRDYTKTLSLVSGHIQQTTDALLNHGRAEWLSGWDRSESIRRRRSA